MFNRMPYLMALLACLWLPMVASAQPVGIETTTANGTVPGTAITYTITADGTPREIFAPGVSDNGVWEWLNGFPEFLAQNTQTLTVGFSAPLPLEQLVLGVNSISGGTFTLTVSGGTAVTTDFDLSDGLTAVGGAAPATYDGATGVFSTTGGDQSLMIGSTATTTLTQFSITGDNLGDGYTLFFGFELPVTLPPPAPVAVPAFSSIGLLLLALVLLMMGGWTIRRSLHS